MIVKLVIVRGQPQGKCLHFPQGEFLIGRGRECHLRANSSWVSRQHCLLQIAEERVVLRDLGSTNGTLINGKRVVDAHLLVPGDHIQIGPLVFEIQLEQTAHVRTQPGISDTVANFNETDAQLLKLCPPAARLLPDALAVDASELTKPR